MDFINAIPNLVKGFEMKKGSIIHSSKGTN